MTPEGAGRSHVCLLRGINVGGRNRVPMENFRASLEALGCHDVLTYIQSGNAVFRWEGSLPAGFAASVHEKIRDATGTSCEVVTVGARQFFTAANGNPYIEEPSPTKVHLVFFANALTEQSKALIQAAAERARSKGSPDRAEVIGEVLYLHTPDGLGRSLLAAELAKLPRSAQGTARNWATVTHLRGLLDPTL